MISPATIEKSDNKMQNTNVKTAKAAETSKRASIDFKVGIPKCIASLRRRSNQVNFLGKGKHLSLKELELLKENISDIADKFLVRHNNKEQMAHFKNTYKNYINTQDGYIDIILIIKYCKDFNLFDHIPISISLLDGLNEKGSYSRKALINCRNIIFLKILVVANELFKKEEQGDVIFYDANGHQIFESLSFLDSHVETFKNLIVLEGNILNLEYDVEVFFLSYLGYLTQSKVAIQKFHEYFKIFIGDCDLELTMEKFVMSILNKSKFQDFLLEELIIMRKIFNNCINRKFFKGIYFLMNDLKFCLIFTEGRLWNSIFKNFTNEQIYALWLKYDQHLAEIHKTNTRTTLDLEYSKQLENLTELIRNEEKQLVHESSEHSTINSPKIYVRKPSKIVGPSLRKMEMEKELEMGFVISLKDLLMIMFKSEFKELILFFFDKIKLESASKRILSHKKKTKIAKEVFELCLENDEDISIEALDNILQQDSVETSYIQMALMKKYFKLSFFLLKKSEKCKNFLNSPPPDSEFYFILMHKHQLKQKKKKYQQIQLENLQDSKDQENPDEEEEEGNMQQEEEISEEIGEENLGDSNSDASNNPKREKIHHLSVKELRIKKSIEPHNKTIKKVTTFNLQSKNSQFQETDFAKLQQPVVENNSRNNSDDSAQVNDVVIINEEVNQKSEKAESHFSFGRFLSLCTPSKIKPISNTLDSQLKDIGTNSYCGINTNQTNTNTNSNLLTNSPGVIKTKKVSTTLSKKLSFPKPNKNLNKSVSGGRQSGMPEEIKIEDVKKKKYDIDVQMILIDQIRKGEYIYFCLCLLHSIGDKFLITEYSEKLCKNFMLFARDDEEIVKCRYPLIVCVLAAEFLEKVGNLNPKVQLRCKSVAELMLHMGERLQWSMKNEAMLYYYLAKQTDSLQRNALEIIAQNRFLNFLTDQVDSIIGQFCFGLGEERSILKFSRIIRIFLSDFHNQCYNDLISSQCYPKNTVYAFHYQQYTKNCSMRFEVESLATISLAICYQSLVFYCMLSSLSSESLNNTRYFINLTYITDFSTHLILVDHLLYIIFIYKTHRKFSFSFRLFIDIMAFLASIAMNCLKSFQNIISADSRDPIIFTNAACSIVIAMLWLRVIDTLSTSQFYGNFLRVINDLKWHFISFFSFFFCFISFYAQVFAIFFKNTNTQFSSFFSAWMTLFNASFGIYDYEQFGKMKIFGYCLLTTFIAMSNVGLLNLVIAIINNLFHKYDARSEAENRAAMILKQEKMKWNDMYGLLILLPVPFNIFSIFFSVILLLLKDEKRIIRFNEIFSKICYFIIALLTFLVLLILSVLLFPFTYVKSLIHSAYDNYISVQFTPNTIIWILITICYRPINLLTLLCKDIYIFWKIVYAPSVIEEVDKEKPLLTKDAIDALRKILLHFRYKNQKKIIKVDEIRMLTIKAKKHLGKLPTMNSQQKYYSNTLLSSNEYQNILTGTGSGSGSVSDDSSQYSGHTLHKQRKSKCKNTMSCINSFKNSIKLSQELYYLIDKISDEYSFIDIEKSLVILEPLAKYSENYLESIYYFNIRVLQRGMRKFLFINAINNPVFAYKKLQQIIYKILIKFKMIYSMLPAELAEIIRTKFEELNFSDEFSKGHRAFAKQSQLENCSDYDDDGEMWNNESTLPQFEKQTMMRVSVSTDHLLDGPI